MTVKIIKNLENKMETWIDLRHRLRKMQAVFNKDLNELWNKQSTMNNTITNTKNTLEGNSSRVIEAEEWTSELGHKRVEITVEEQNKGKRRKDLKIISETSGRIQNAHLKYRGPRRRRGKERV